MPRTPFRLFSPIQFGPGPQDEESELGWFHCCFQGCCFCFEIDVLKAGFKIVESSSSLISLASSIQRTTRNYIDKQRKSATSIELSKMLSDFMEKFKIDSEFRLSEPSIKNCGTITKNLWTIRTPSTEASKKLKSVSPILSEEGLRTVDDSQTIDVINDY